jgi:hypothetical protein
VNSGRIGDTEGNHTRDGRKIARIVDLYCAAMCSKCTDFDEIGSVEWLLMLRWMWLSLAIGCGFEHGVAPGGSTDGGAIGDGANGDSTVLPGDAGNCWSLAGLSTTVCLTAPPSGNINVNNDVSIDTTATGTGNLDCKALVAGSTNVCVVAAGTITIAQGATLSASGDRPLVLIATTITIDGVIDVASHRGGQIGPGSDMPGCNAGTSPSNAGGGQGGSFGAIGGNGGDQASTNNSGGRAGAALSISMLRGGCRGMTGGDTGGTSGRGGGAVALIGSITLAATARINASGAGAGGAGDGSRGGGGAGSGGMIVLSGPITVASATQIFANGGHGGGGSDDEESGSSGTDPTVTTGGSGGGAPDGAGDGGDGFPAATRTGQDGTSSGNGGGGGGGGAGVIKVLSSSSIGTAQVSPPPS